MEQVILQSAIKAVMVILKVPVMAAMQLLFPHQLQRPIPLLVLLTPIVLFYQSLLALSPSP
jgi:hypothetical protein